MRPYILVLFIFAATQVFAEDEDDGGIMSCVELFKPETMTNECCQSMVMKEEYKSCLPEDMKDWDCGNAKCVLDKIGILSGDTIDDEKAGEALKKAMMEKPEGKAMFERVQNKCLQGKYEDYPPKETCPLIKFQICTYINSIVECSSWKQDDACQKMSESAKTCKSTLDKME